MVQPIRDDDHWFRGPSALCPSASKPPPFQSISCICPFRLEGLKPLVASSASLPPVGTLMCQGRKGISSGTNRGNWPLCPRPLPLFTVNPSC